VKLEDLNRYYNKFKFGEDIFHHLMQKEIKEILLISSIFDAYVLEQDSRLSEQIYGEYKQLNLMMAPRITTISFTDDIDSVLKEKKFDAVIIMMRIGVETPGRMCNKIKEYNAELPILLLLNKKSYIELIEQKLEILLPFNEVFIWNGDSKLFVAMIKLMEDFLNVENDTKIGDVRIILFIESSIDYYSTFLPLMYSVEMQLTQELIDSEDEVINKRLRMRARPKILMAHNYEDAISIYVKYKKNILSVISNANLKVNGIFDIEGGIKLMKMIRKENPSMPMMLQSADEGNVHLAKKINVEFLYKYSNTLYHDLKEFIKTNLGFGKFIFRDAKGNELARARTLYHLEKTLEKISEESILYHVEKNQFSSWLMAHSEIGIAKRLKDTTAADFDSTEEIRQYLLTTIRNVRQQQNRGKVIKFNPAIFTEEDKIIQLADGSMGGKGRGLAFLNALLVTVDLGKEFENVNVKIPKTAIICTNEFDSFIEKNKVISSKFRKKSDEEINKFFLNGKLTSELISKLEILIQNVKVPLAVRSSGLLEDSQSQPFAGIYKTYMLPNNNPDDDIRLKQLCDAVKLVLASPFLESARKYIESINFKIEEEKMAVIIQEVVGSKDAENLFYPHFAGAAQSYNFYPPKDMFHEDGIVALAAGLGKAVVDGERAFRYCPKYPRVNLLEPIGIVENNQRDFYAVNLSFDEEQDVNNEDKFLTKRRIRTSHKEGVFKEITSVWDYERFQFLDGAFVRGPRMLTYRNIIYYNKFPLSDILLRILEIGQIASGVPIEIEFAINLDGDKINNFPTFYMLQIRPLSVNKENINIKLDKIKREEMMLSATRAMGNGEIKNIRDIVFIDPDRFDNTQTLEIMTEIEKINNYLEKSDREYVLLGHGRWGTSDRFLGVPVRWAQINKAKIIVEASQENFTVEASQGSHFFHNLVAMSVGYFTVSHSSDSDFIDWEWLKSLPARYSGKYAVHVELKKTINIQIDGKKGIALISKVSK
jgi:hypothetical protein